VIEFERELRRKILRSLGKIEGLSTVISIGMTILIPGCQTGVCAMIFNAAMADANGGTIGQVLSGAAIGWVTGGITQGLTDLLGGTWQAQLGAMMFMGGITAKAQGGKFADGVKGGAISFGLVRIMSAVGEPARMTGEDTAAAKAAGDVYGSDGGLLKELGINYEPRDGFAAALTLDESIGQHILAFRGTSPTSFSDWMANIGQGLIGSSSQYDQARVLARAVHAKLGGNVIFAGHSLGGGLASAAAFATGGRAITFNAAGLHSSYRTGTPGDIRAHYIRGDILTTLQRFTPMPNAAGTPVGHSGSWYQGPMQRHMISNFR
ncbi:MAG: DUF2974 domain-containing protein, partial [Porticoccaceae bacterium]|nr:DUF2974 domain-containing protein [Porticoccaceae bacterium]